MEFKYRKYKRTGKRIENCKFYFSFTKGCLLFVKPSIVCKLIEASKGMLSGIGRRMTSLIFGGNMGKNATVNNHSELFIEFFF